MQQLPFSFVSCIQGDLWFCSDCAVAVGQLPCCAPSTSPQCLLPIFMVALTSFSYRLCPESGRPWEYLNYISDGLWKEGSLLAETAQGCRSGTLQRKGWRVCGWSPEACQRRRKPVPWWIYSLFQPLPGDWYSLQGVQSTTKRDFTYRNFFSFLNWKQPFLILMERSERTM